MRTDTWLYSLHTWRSAIRLLAGGIISVHSMPTAAVDSSDRMFILVFVLLHLFMSCAWVEDNHSERVLTHLLQCSLSSITTHYLSMALTHRYPKWDILFTVYAQLFVHVHAWCILKQHWKGMSDDLQSAACLVGDHQITSKHFPLVNCHSGIGVTWLFPYLVSHLCFVPVSHDSESHLLGAVV